MSTTERMPYRRRSRFTATLNDAATPDMRRDVAAEAEAEHCAAADVIRQCIADALPRLRARRPKRRTQARPETVTAART